MRVLHIEYGVGFGGSAISLAELVRGLHEVTPTESVILTFQAAGLNEDAYPTAKVIRKRRTVSYHTRTQVLDALSRWRVPAPLRWVVLKTYGVAHLVYERYLAHYIANLVRAHRIDVVHANSGWERSAILGSLWGGARCVIHFRGFPRDEPGSVASRFGKDIDRNITGYIGISKGVAAAIGGFGAPPEKIVTVPNPVSPEPYAAASIRREPIRSQLGIGESDVVASIFGRVTGWKGQAEFLEAVRLIVAECPMLRVMIVGDESDDTDTRYIGRVRTLAERPELLGRVVFAGFQKDVMGYFAASDIVVHASQAPEPFGRVVIEAMAAGRAIVAMNEGGPAEIITQMVDGILVPPRDVSALADAIRRLYRDPVLRDRLALAAQRSVPERFSPQSIAKQVFDVFSVPAS